VTAAAALLTFGASPPSLQTGLESYTAEKSLMGTVARITLYAPNADRAVAGFRAAFDLLDALDARLSDYRPASELMSLSRWAGQGPVPVSPELFEVLDLARRIAAETGGAFDPTLGPLTRIWRRSRREGRLPEPEALERARRLCGWRKLDLDPVRRTASLATPGMQLDLGGIAKGYAADRALELLRGMGLRQTLVVIGGEMAIGAPPPGRSGWRIAVGPEETAGHPRRILRLSDCGVSTSGDLQQHLDVGNRRYSHILEPASGKALTDAATVTVVAPAAALADALATAFDVLGPALSQSILEQRRGVRALWWKTGRARRRAGAPAPVLGRPAAAPFHPSR